MCFLFLFVFYLFIIFFFFGGGVGGGVLKEIAVQVHGSFGVVEG